MILRETVLVYISKSAITAAMFLYWEIGLLHIFNIVKNMIHDFIRDISKTIVIINASWITGDWFINNRCWDLFFFILICLALSSFMFSLWYLGIYSCRYTLVSSCFTNWLYPLFFLSLCLSCNLSQAKGCHNNNAKSQSLDILL